MRHTKRRTQLTVLEPLLPERFVGFGLDLLFAWIQRNCRRVVQVEQSQSVISVMHDDQWVGRFVEDAVRAHEVDQVRS